MLPWLAIQIDTKDFSNHKADNSDGGECTTQPMSPRPVHNTKLSQINEILLYASHSERERDLLTGRTIPSLIIPFFRHLSAEGKDPMCAAHYFPQTEDSMNQKLNKYPGDFFQIQLDDTWYLNSFSQLFRNLCSIKKLQTPDRPHHQCIVHH